MKLKKPERRALLDAFIRSGELTDPPAAPPGAPGPGARAAGAAGGTPEKRDLSIGGQAVTQTASVIVQAAFYSMILRAMRKFDALFDPDVTTFVSSKNGSTLLIPTLDDTAQAAQVVGEGGQDQDVDPTLAGVLIPTASTYRTGLEKLSLELLEDNAFDGGQFLADAFAIRLARGIGAGIVATALAGAADGATGGSNSTVTPDDVLALIKSIDPAYLEGQKAGLAMSFATLLAVLGTKTTTGAYVLPTEFDAAGRYVIFGLPVFISPSMPAIASQAKPVLCGDFGYLAVRTVEGAQTLQRLDERFADYGQVAFRGWLRASSALGIGSALKYLQQPT